VTIEDRSPKHTRALAIIAEESGLALNDLTDNTVFADVGVDSLLGLTISARFKEELDIELDFNALFYEHPTVADLKAAFGSSSASTTGSSTPQWADTNPSTVTVTGKTTPDTDDRSLLSQQGFYRALEIVSEESGLAIGELTDDMNFADAGVDSLLSLVVVSRLRDELELDIQHETLFLDCPTIADLKRLLVGGVDTESIEPDLILSPSTAQSDSALTQTNQVLQGTAVKTSPEEAALGTRRNAVEKYVDMYTAGYACPSPSQTSTLPDRNEKVVLVTGGTGSLGGHLVYHFAQLPDVKTVVCLNREHKAEPYDRQQKAMRGKGIRFPEDLKPKLLVLQADSSKPMLGLGKEQYDSLLGSVTHLVHNAWPMSAKRPLSGFESQFQVLRNLIDFACGVSARRPETFKFSFQMVSSIGVVGRYGLGNGADVTEVPEARVDIDSVLANGYGEAKWGCEKMLDQTLHKHPTRFRTMAVRLGQIAGSKTSGYWNPMEHFGFLVKSSQTLGALPDVSGKAYWTPVNDVAATLSDLVLAERTPHAIYHIESPVGQPWSELNKILADALNIPDLIPFEDWVNRVRNTPQHNNPASTLLEFLDSNYLRMSCGGLVLDVTHTLEHSESLAAVKEVSEDVVRKYVHVWKEIGFLN
jgi:thioester reductase-like protein/acyl carrier protein